MTARLAGGPGAALCRPSAAIHRRRISCQSNILSTIKQAVADLLNPALAVPASMDRHFAPAFRQRVNGRWLDRAAFITAIVALRQGLAEARLRVLDEFVDGARYAERHRIALRMADGAVVQREVYVFAQRDAHGRFLLIEEASIAVDVAEDPLAADPQ